MSVKHSAWAWEHSRAEGGALLVLLALSDSVNHLDGSDECWPKREVLARRVRLTESHVSRCLAELEELGEIERARTQTGNRYRLLMPDVRKSHNGTDATSDVAPMPHSNVAPMPHAKEEPEGRTGKEPEDHAQGALLPDPVDEVWAHYQQALDRPKAQLTPKVRKWIADAIKSVGVEDSKLAISGLAASEYHRDNHYVGIEYALVPKRGQTIESRVEMMAGKVSDGKSSNAAPTVRELLANLPSGAHDGITTRMERARIYVESSPERRAADRYMVETGMRELELLRTAPPYIEPVLSDGKVRGWQRVS